MYIIDMTKNIGILRSTETGKKSYFLLEGLLDLIGVFLIHFIFLVTKEFLSHLRTPFIYLLG